MAVWCLQRAFETLDLLPATRSAELIEKMRISHEELDRWGDITRKMRLCFHDDGILSQFEGYDQLEELDWSAYRERYGNIGRLDRILEAEGDSTNRYKLAKQADTLMLFHLLSDAELGALLENLGYECDDEFFERNLRYYEQRTAHGSTLSGMVHAWLHSRQDPHRGWGLFREALESDINDVQGGTTAEGIHLGAMAGTVDLVQRCYGGHRGPRRQAPPGPAAARRAARAAPVDHLPEPAHRAAVHPRADRGPAHRGRHPRGGGRGRDPRRVEVPPTRRHLRGAQVMPWSTAQRISSCRRDRCSFAIVLRTWFSTVFGEMNSASPTAL